MTSCKEHPENIPSQVNYDLMFGYLSTNLDKDCAVLKIIIQKQEAALNNSSNKQYYQFKKSTEEYLNYLDQLETLSLKLNSNPFFDQNIATKHNLIFVNKSKLYLTKYENLKLDNLLKNRIDLLLGLEDIEIDENKFVKYMDWHFNGAELNTLRYLIRNRRRNVLILQKEVVNSFCVAKRRANI